MFLTQNAVREKDESRVCTTAPHSLENAISHDIHASRFISLFLPGRAGRGACRLSAEREKIELNYCLGWQKAAHILSHTQTNAERCWTRHASDTHMYMCCQEIGWTCIFARCHLLCCAWTRFDSCWIWVSRCWTAILCRRYPHRRRCCVFFCQIAFICSYQFYWWLKCLFLLYLPKGWQEWMGKAADENQPMLAGSSACMWCTSGVLEMTGISRCFFVCSSCQHGISEADPLASKFAEAAAWLCSFRQNWANMPSKFCQKIFLYFQICSSDSNAWMFWNVLDMFGIWSGTCMEPMEFCKLTPWRHLSSSQEMSDTNNIFPDVTYIYIIYIYIFIIFLYII